MLMDSAAGSAAPRSRRVCLCAAPAPAQGEAKRSKRRSWLRSQRSLDQWAPVGGGEESAPAQPSRARRARSAERFEGVRIGEGPPVAASTPLQLATPTPSACTPPPSYEAAVSKSALPSYEECVRSPPPTVALSCTCARCKPPDAVAAGRTTSSAAGVCPCAKCQPYGHPAYGHPANVNTAVLISLDTAMHSALADGVALCVLM